MMSMPYLAKVSMVATILLAVGQITASEFGHAAANATLGGQDYLGYTFYALALTGLAIMGLGLRNILLQLATFMLVWRETHEWPSAPLVGYAVVLVLILFTAIWRP